MSDSVQAYRMTTAIPTQDMAVQSLLQAEIPEMELIAKIIEDEQRLIMLPYADETHIVRWEKSLGIKAVAVDLEERRRYLLTTISSKLKVSTDTLAELSQRFTNVQAMVSVDNMTITVKFLGELPKVSLNRFTNYIKAMVPAHLNVGINVDAPMENTIYMRGFLGPTIVETKFN